MSVLTLMLMAPHASAHKDPDTGLSISPTPNDSYQTPAALDGKTFGNPSFRVILQDNAPYSYGYWGGTSTSTTAYLELDLTLGPAGPCSSTGYIDLQKRDLNASLSAISPWVTTNSFDKMSLCSNASPTQAWHFGRDSIGFVAQGARDFEFRLVDRRSGAVYLATIGKGAYVTPRAPSALTVTSATPTTVNLQWKDNSAWENHMELQRTNEGGSWSTIGRPMKADSTSVGLFTYQDSFPLSPFGLYRYRVRAVSGDQVSAWTPIVTTSTPPQPLGFASTAVEARRVALRWDNVYGEDLFEVQRSKDDFTTIDTYWSITGDVTSLVDSSSEGLETYQYRIRAVNDRGASAWSELEVTTPGLLEPMIPEFTDAINTECSAFQSEWPAMSCIHTNMYEFRVHTVEVEVCSSINGGPMVCQKQLLVAPQATPSLPDDDDPGVPPPPLAPDGTPWVPPHAPGENPWQWGGSEAIPTNKGSWWRDCIGAAIKEYLHWDSPHDAPKPNHWGYEDCKGKRWEMPHNWQQYGKAWYPHGVEWWL